MKLKRWLKEEFTLHSVSKKVFIISKIMALLMLLLSLYLLFEEQYGVSQIQWNVWAVCVVVIVLSADQILTGMITKPLIRINNTASRMARLLSLVFWGSQPFSLKKSKLAYCGCLAHWCHAGAK